MQRTEKQGLKKIFRTLIFIASLYTVNDRSNLLINDILKTEFNFKNSDTCKNKGEP